jgi:hypothetical protein
LWQCLPTIPALSLQATLLKFQYKTFIARQRIKQDCVLSLSSVIIFNNVLLILLKNSSRLLSNTKSTQHTSVQLFTYSLIHLCSHPFTDACSYAVMQLCSYAVMQLCSYAVMQLCSYVSMQVCKYASDVDTMCYSNYRFTIPADYQTTLYYKAVFKCTPFFLTSHWCTHFTIDTFIVI